MEHIENNGNAMYVEGTKPGNQVVDYDAHNGNIGNPITAMLMSQANAADMSASDHADGAGVQLGRDTDGTADVTGHASPGHATEGAADQVRAAGDELADHLLEIENLVEGARDAVVRRLEQFDQLDERVRLVDHKLDLLLAHFGLAV